MGDAVQPPSRAYREELKVELPNYKTRDALQPHFQTVRLPFGAEMVQKNQNFEEEKLLIGLNSHLSRVASCLRGQLEGSLTMEATGSPNEKG